MTLYDRNMSETYVYSDDTAYLMTKILDYSVDNGTSKKLSNLTYDVAGKTGTVAVPNTNKNTDAYSLAYTTDHTMSVWLGNYSMVDEYHLLGSNNGGTFATQIINDTFTDMYKDNPPDNFVVPDSVQEVTIDNKSLTEDHIVVSGNNIPERYQSTIMISKRYPLKNTSTKFAQINPFDINIQSYKNSCEITYQTYDYIDYKLYRVHNGKIELLDTIKNHQGEYSYVDRNLIQGELYSYYVEAYSNYSDNKFVSNSKQVVLEKSYDELLSNNNDDLAWMFS
jgi:membrane carboxypeptidase/penicillin-binding protein PbpC